MLNYRLKRGKFFDDEASLSGSDVGSDGEEDPDSNDEYEVDECELTFIHYHTFRR